MVSTYAIINNCIICASGCISCRSTAGVMVSEVLVVVVIVFVVVVVVVEARILLILVTVAAMMV